MSHFLFAWEFGSGLGHLHMQRSLAAALAGRGHRVSFVLRDLSRAHDVLGTDAAIYQAPVWGAPPAPPQPPREFAELLARLGYLDSRAVTGFARGWRALLALLAPDLLVCDYAPTALLATHGTALPRVMLGTGFTCPPPVAHLPFDPRQALPGDNPLVSRVLAALNDTLRALGAAPLADLGALHTVERQLLCTWAELDPFAGARRDRADYRGPLGSQAAGLPAPRAGTGRRVFAYLKPAVAATVPVLQALAACDAEVLAFVPGASSALRAQLAPSRVRIVTAALDMAAALDGCDLAVCHGGHGTTCASLLAGVPVLFIPAQGEQALTARSVAARGLGG
ncbi:MAG: glycosyltransferase, partial [Gammaproteobacteria bacterium]